MRLRNPRETVSYLRLSSWFYSLIWNYRYSHVLSLVFTVVEAKCGIVRPESTTFSEDNNSDSEIEDVVETIPEPSPGVQGFSHPAFPSPEPLAQPVKSLAGFGLTKVSCFVCNSFFPALFHMPFTCYVPLWWQKGYCHRNGSLQSRDTKWCDSKSNIWAWFRFINVCILSMPLWKKKITKQLERTARWIWRWGAGWSRRIHLRTRWIWNGMRVRMR